MTKGSFEARLAMPKIYRRECCHRAWDFPATARVWACMDILESTLWYASAFSSNSSGLRPVFSNNILLPYTYSTKLMSTTEFLSTSELWCNIELSSTGVSEKAPVWLGLC